MSQGSTVAVIHAAAQDQAKLVDAVPRPPRLERTVLGLVDNTRTNSDRFLRVVAGPLEKSRASAAS